MNDFGKLGKKYHPCAEQLALVPDISGNTINGLGETEFRRPGRIYWHRPDAIAHGKMQEWMVGRFNAVPAYRDVYAKGDRGPQQLDPVVPQASRNEPAEWVKQARQYASQHEADLVAITGNNPDWYYAGCEPSPHPWLILIGVEMDHAKLAQSPSSDTDTASALEVARQYNRGARAAANLANWIRAQGYDSVCHAGPWAGSMTLTPAALACGFGELGKHGNVINRIFGSSFRLSGVVTDMPLAKDVPAEFGADDFCTRCQVCLNACPPGAIANDKQVVRGVEKWYVDFDKCIPYFNETHGCGICIAVCPWSRPGAAPRLAEKMLRRRKRQKNRT